MTRVCGVKQRRPTLLVSGLYVGTTLCYSTLHRAKATDSYTVQLAGTKPHQPPRMGDRLVVAVGLMGSEDHADSAL